MASTIATYGFSGGLLIIAILLIKICKCFYLIQLMNLSMSLSQHARKPYGWQQKWWICFYSAQNDIDSLFDLDKWQPSWIVPTMQCVKIFFYYDYIGHARKPYGRHQNHKYVYSVENYINLLFGLVQMAPILDFTHNVMLKIFCTAPLCRRFPKTR